MKNFALVLLVALTLSCGMALRCNNCIGTGCRNRVETCQNAYDVCARVLYLPPLKPSYFKRCMKESDCLILQSQPSLMSTYCCKQDLCN